MSQKEFFSVYMNGLMVSRNQQAPVLVEKQQYFLRSQHPQYAGKRVDSSNKTPPGVFRKSFDSFYNK